MTQPANPIVSVGIPTYNRPDGLRKTLQAITAQSYPNLEIIISDNCSEDPAVATVAKEFAAIDDRIIYLRQSSNIGLYNNFHCVLQAASGKYFMWAADDDWWDARFIECTLRMLEASPDACVALTHFTLVSANPHNTRKYPPYFEYIKQLGGLALFERMRQYIKQKETFGKSQIIYGLMTRDAAVAAFRDAVKLLEKTMDPAAFLPFDYIFVCILLTHGNVLTCNEHLREFSVGDRTPARGSYKTLLEKILRYNKVSIVYFNIYHDIINSLNLTNREKSILHNTVTWRKIMFFMERIGRALFVYRIYMYFYKQRKFEKCIR
jgi:glycosyltransferase involved in cell wall biosynthesis